MPPAPRIKPRPTPRTSRLTLHILPNRHLQPASSAQNRPHIPLPSPPNRNSVPRQSLMTILASPVHPATPHLDRNHIRRRPVVHTPRLRIHLDPTNLWLSPPTPFNHHHSIRAPCSSGTPFGPEAFLFFALSLCSSQALARLASKASAPDLCQRWKPRTSSPGERRLQARGMQPHS